MQNVDKNGLPILRKKTKEEIRIERELKTCPTKAEIFDMLNPIEFSLKQIVINLSALVTLLVEKGVFMEDEFETTLNTVNEQFHLQEQERIQKENRFKTQQN